MLHGSDGQLYCIAFQRSPTPIHSVTAYMPILLRFGPVPLPGTSGPPLSPVPSFAPAGSGGEFRISFTGEPGRTYVFQFSNDFPPQWQEAASVSADEQGNVQFSEAIPTTGAARFFRVTAD